MSPQAKPEGDHTGTLAAVLRWGLKGNHAEDLVLSVVGTAMVVTAGALAGKASHPTLTSILGQCADAARECAMGQFITEVQGAKAMMQARKGKEFKWQEHSRMEAIGALLAGQARDALGDPTSGHMEGRREVVSIVGLLGDKRRLELRRPSQEDWEFLDVARRMKGEADAYRSTWLSFALMVLCASQAAAGLWELEWLPSRGKGKLRGLAFAEDAREAIGADLDKWLEMGFIQEPMVCEPEQGDYLTVKHRRVAGAPGPRGTKTDARDTEAWDLAAEHMAGTPWTVAVDTLRYAQLRDAAVEGGTEGSTKRAMVLGAAARLALEDSIYLPTFMDFRGRVYYRPSLITIQGSDLQKGLLCFPDDGSELTASGQEAVISHMAALYGGPQKLDKAPYQEREDWWYGAMERPVEEALEVAEEPLQLYTAWSMLQGRQPSRIACQIDGTCNGLQHLSALFRDQEAAKHVNICASTREDRPADIYSRVAEAVGVRLALARDHAWVGRILATTPITRSLTKKPVMVLPYGGTLNAIEAAVLEAVLEIDPTVVHQGVQLCPWRECLRPGGQGGWVRDEEAIAGDYLAFRDRDLANHPLLRLDCQRLGGLIWAAIHDLLPKPMLAMKTFRTIAAAVGERSLEWNCGGDRPLWIVQAKAQSAVNSMLTKGFHLPETVRSLSVRQGRDKISKEAHRRGIVANFIHSNDADHLKRTMKGLPRSTPFAAIHDCYLGRPNFMESLGRITREAFREKYTGDQHPLECPVRLRDITTGEVQEYANWYLLAEACKTEFPVVGTWLPQEVLESAWFFS